MTNQKKILKVTIPVCIGDIYDYLSPDIEDIPEEIIAGDVLEVPFGGRLLPALVMDTASDSAVPPEKLKTPTKLLAKQAFSSDLRKFMQTASNYNIITLGQILKMAMPVNDVFKQIRQTKSSKPVVFGSPDISANPVSLNEKQTQAANVLCDKIGKGYSCTLLKGLTGSGKTEVYFYAIAEALRQGGQVLVMLPEIMLTAQWLERFQRTFKTAPACWHSSLTPKTRRETWKAIVNGEAKVLVGARSALFLPFKNLELIIVDEEHDQSYKQEEGTIYQARDMAVLRANCEQIPIILSSATPSVETLANVQSGKYDFVELPQRYKGASLPPIQIVDMRNETAEKINGEKAWISSHLAEAVTKALENKQQSLLFLNRRGYAPLMLCRTCGHRICCPNCSSWLVAHQNKGRLICHYCNYSLPIPSACPECHEETLVFCGPGTERIYEEARLRWNNANIALVTSDTLSSASAAAKLVEEISERKIDILVGTQILTKGHHFPFLTVIGIIDADLGLASDDMRAAERSYQLLNQAAGRAGRGELAGKVYMQTYMPNNTVLQAIAARDEKAFFNSEIQSRKLLNLAPFGKSVSILITGKNEEKTLAAAKNIVKTAPPASYGLEVLGPAPAGLSRLQGSYRFRILIKADKKSPLSSIIKIWLTKVKLPYNIKVQIDVEPYSFM